MTDATPGAQGASSDRPRGKPWTPARRAAAERARADRERRSTPDSARSDVELVAEDQIAEAVANITTLANFALPFAPYTAITIAGVPHPEQADTWLVAPRAQMAGHVLLEHAKRNRRVLAAVARFNLMFKNVELMEVAASVVASVAVDAHVVPADAAIALPGGAAMPILTPVIGDTIAYIAGQVDAGPAVVQTERRTRRTVSSEGVTEPEEPWGSTTGQAEPTADQVAKAHEVRERLRERDERIANGTEPTLRRDGQVIVPGGVEAT